MSCGKSRPQPKPTAKSAWKPRFYLSDLLFDSEQELASAEVLREAVEAVEQDEKLLQNFNRSPDKLRALMHYRYAMHYGKLGDRPQHRHGWRKPCGTIPPISTR